MKRAVWYLHLQGLKVIIDTLRDLKLEFTRFQPLIEHGLSSNITPLPTFAIAETNTLTESNNATTLPILTPSVLPSTVSPTDISTIPLSTKPDPLPTLNYTVPSTLPIIAFFMNKIGISTGRMSTKPDPLPTLSYVINIFLLDICLPNQIHSLH